LRSERRKKSAKGNDYQKKEKKVPAYQINIFKCMRLAEEREKNGSTWMS
jgi:hypothetical protein